MRINNWVKKQFGTWGVFIITLWSTVLAVLALAYILWLVTIAQYMGSNPQQPGLAQLWFVFGLNIIFLIIFGVSAYGLFKRHNWGRLSFLGAITAWSGFNLAALIFPYFSPEQGHTTDAVLFNGLRYTVELIIPWWYLNAPHVKKVFLSSDKSTGEE